MTLWLDADAAPRDVKDVCYRAAERLSLPTILVANMRLQLPVASMVGRMWPISTSPSTPLLATLR
jgi:uncharacterized protein YaiI (UPF0178 family)